MDKKSKAQENENNFEKDVDIKLISWYMNLKSGEIKDLNIKKYNKYLKDAKSSSKKLYFKILVEFINKDDSLFEPDILKENIDLFKDQINYISEFENDDNEFIKNCKSFTFKLLSQIKDFSDLKEGDYLKILLNLILIFILDFFKKETSNYNNNNLLFKCLNGIKKISKVYTPNNPHFINYINELTIMSCFKIFEEEKDFSPEYIFNLCNFIKIHLKNYEHSKKEFLDLKLKNINLCLLYLLYRICCIEPKLKYYELSFNNKRENTNSNKLNEKTEKKSLENVIKDIILKSFSNDPKLINNLLDIISGNFFNEISGKQYTSNNYNNFILSLDNKLKNKIFTNNEDDISCNIFLEKFYNFLLSEDFSNKHFNIKEMIISGLLSLIKIFPLYHFKRNENIYIPYTIFFNILKNVLYREKNIIKKSAYNFIISFISYIIKDFIKELKDSWNEIIEILIILLKNIGDENEKNVITEIALEISKLILYDNLDCNYNKFIELCEIIDSDSILLNIIICNYKMSIDNPNYKNNTDSFINKYIFENNKYKNNYSLIESNYCMVLDKIKYYIQYKKDNINNNFEEILCKYFQNILDYGIKNVKLNQYILSFITECIRYISNIENYCDIINKLFLEYFKGNNSLIQQILYDIFWLLNYGFEKEKMEKFLELLLNKNNFDKNYKFIEKILLNVMVTSDGLIHLKNENKYLFKFQYSPIPILILNNNFKNEKDIFIIFDIQKILQSYFDKMFQNRREINNYKVILKNVENIITLNKDFIYLIHTIFIDSQILLKDFSKEEDKILLKIFSHLNYYYSWSDKFFIGNLNEIENSSFFKNIRSKKDILFQSIFQKMKQYISIDYFFPIYQFYLNTIFESNIDNNKDYSKNTQIYDILNFILKLFVENKNEFKIIINVLNSIYLFKEIIHFFNEKIENQFILVLSLIAFPENEKYLIEKFKSQLNINLPKADANNLYIQNKIEDEENESKDENNFLFIKDYAKNLLLLYFFYFSKVNSEILLIFKNLPNIKKENEFKYLYKLSDLEIKYNLKKRYKCSKDKLDKILSNKNPFIKYIIIEDTLIISYPEDENKVSLIIINQYCNFEYLIEIPKSNSNFLSDQEQIKIFNKTLNKKDIEINNEKSYSKTKYNNQPQYLLFKKENISKIILQIISDIPINDKISKIEEMKDITNENIDRIKHIFQKSIYKICNINIIYNPYSFFSNLNEKELFDENKDNYSKEFLEFLSNLGDLKIDKKTSEITLFYEDFINRVNIFLFDSIKDKEKKDNLIIKSQIEIIWLDYPNQKINDYLKKINNSYYKIYIFILPIIKNLYKVQLRVKKIEEKNNKHYYFEEYINKFINNFFLKDFMINLNCPSGIRYFKTILIILNSRINYIKEKSKSKNFITKEEKIINKISKLKSQ